MSLEFNEYIRKPFTVQSCLVTEENIEAIAVHVGELEKLPDGTVFIKVDRRMVPNVFRVFPGFYMTKMGDHIRCYSPKVFAEQFAAMTPEIKDWVNFINKANA